MCISTVLYKFIYVQHMSEVTIWSNNKKHYNRITVTLS